MKNRSGGVCIFIKETIYNNYDVILCNDHCDVCKALCNAMDSILWCIIGNVLFSVVYIAPESSVYVDRDIFEKMSLTIVELLSHFNISQVCILGDFNARTGTLQDYILPDESLLRSNVISDYLIDHIIASVNDSIGKRLNSDNTVNTVNM